MRYSQLIWTHSSSTEPVEILSEYDKDGWELRKVEVFADGRLGYASDSKSGGGSELALIPSPPEEEVNNLPEFQVLEMTKVQFEAAWENAIQARNMTV